MSKPTSYLLGLLCTLVVAELVCRWAEPSLEAASHRARFKLAVLNAHPTTDVLVFGTSRTEMALSPTVLGETAATHGRPLSALNLSISNTSIEYFEYLCREAAHDATHARYALIELAEPALTHEALEWQPPREQNTFDQRAWSTLLEHFALVRLRTAFRFENLARLALTAFSIASLDGSEHSGVDVLTALTRGHGHRAPNLDRAQWPLRIERPAPQAPSTELETHPFVECAKTLKQRGVSVAFFVLPTKWAPESYERRPVFRNFIAAVASQSDSLVLDFTPAPVPEHYFRDWTHLLAPGQAAFSEVLTEVLFDEHFFGDANAL